MFIYRQIIIFSKYNICINLCFVLFLILTKLIAILSSDRQFRHTYIHISWLKLAPTTPVIDDLATASSRPFGFHLVAIYLLRAIFPHTTAISTPFVGHWVGPGNPFRDWVH